MRQIEKYSKHLLAKNLKYLRGNLSLAKLSKILDIAIPTLSQYETGARSPRLDTLILICEHYNISLDTIYTQDLEMHASILPITDKVLQGNRTLENPNILRKFEDLNIYCYYYSESRSDTIREGLLKLFKQYGEEREFVAGEFKSYGQSYFCKLVVEKDEYYYIYGTNMTSANRMMMAFKDHSFLKKSEKLHHGIGLALSTSSLERLIAQPVVLSSIKLLDNPDIPDGNQQLAKYLSMVQPSNNGIILSEDAIADFAKWHIQYLLPQSR